MLLGWALLAVFAAVGAALPGAPSVQPNRFAVAAYLFLSVPASVGVLAIWNWLRTPTQRTRTIGLGFAALCAASFGYSLIEVVREVSYAPVGHYGAEPPEIRALGEKSSWLLDWLANDTTADGRILFETSKARIHDQAHMAGYYALTSDREFIGGPYPFMFTASFWDGTLFGRPVDSIAQAEFERDLDLYNIGWVVAHSEASKRYLAGIPSLVEVAVHDDLTVYRATRALDYFAAGKGRIEERSINRVVLSGLESDEVIVKYHFVPGLTADAPAEVQPVSLAGDDRPFVRILPHGERRVTLSVR
jgi:hypothetical protein